MGPQCDILLAERKKDSHFVTRREKIRKNEQEKTIEGLTLSFLGTRTGAGMVVKCPDAEDGV